MKTLIADRFSENQIDRLNQLGCEVTYQPAVKAEELPQLIAPYKILVVRSKQVTADTLKASDQLASFERIMLWGWAKNYFPPSSGLAAGKADSLIR